MPDAFTWESPRNISITVRRWDVRISIVDKDGQEHVYIASADSYYTDRNNIWFGTAEEHAEDRG